MLHALGDCLEEGDAGRNDVDVHVDLSHDLGIYHGTGVVWIGKGLRKPHWPENGCRYGSSRHISKLRITSQLDERRSQKLRSKRGRDDETGRARHVQSPDHICGEAHRQQISEDI